MIGRVLRYEWGMWRSLYRWIFRRPLPQTPFSYASLITPVMVGIIVVSFIEIPVLHMIIPWEKPRFILDLLGVYGLFWMIGMLAAYRVHPHSVADDGVHVRNGISIHIPLSWGEIETVRLRTKSYEKSRTLQQTESALSVTLSSQTNVDIVLTRPVTVQLPGKRTATITELSLYADDASAFVAAVRERLAEFAAATGLERQTG